MIILHFIHSSWISLLDDSKVIYLKNNNFLKIFLKYKNKQVLLCHATKFILILFTRELYIQFIECWQCKRHNDKYKLYVFYNYFLFKSLYQCLFFQFEYLYSQNLINEIYSLVLLSE
jgi:hypothetical protein